MATFNVVITYDESKNLNPNAAVPLPEVTLMPDGVQYLPDFVKEHILVLLQTALTDPQYSLDVRMKEEQRRQQQAEEEKLLAEMEAEDG